MDKKFYKSYAREMSLFNCEYWYSGERYGVFKLIEEVAFFEPLFIYKQGLTSIYYESPLAEKAESRVVKYFKEDQARFMSMIYAHEQYCKDLSDLIRSNSIYDISRIFELLKRIWPLVSLTYILGKHEIKGALSSRKKISDLEYLGAQTLYNLVLKKMLALDTINLLSISEIIDDKLPSLDELKKRQEGFIY